MNRLEHFLAMYLFEQEVMEEARKVAEGPEAYARVLAIMWCETKTGLRDECERRALDVIDGMRRLEVLGFDRVKNKDWTRVLATKGLV